jgi:RsiW-degrading membrane proteinase PrsW (M82 family)
MIKAAAALTPILVFLALLVRLDSFKLLPPRTVLRAMAGGGLAAVAGLAINHMLLTRVELAAALVTRYAAPLVEEAIKLAVVALAVQRRQVGFPVDAAIFGASVGTGFALVENAYYLQSLAASSGLAVWLVRGFGAATLHAAATGIAAILSQTAAARHPDRGWVVFLPGAVAAFAIHSAYNHFVLPPVVATLILLATLPPLVLVVFERSERATHEWVGAGLDLDMELLRLLLSNEFGETRLGKYLAELRARLPGPVVADMFCLMRLDLELAIRAKGMLLAREAGLDVKTDDVPARLQEIAYLERSIGPTGLLALKPLHTTSHRDAWHRAILASEAR